MDRAEVFKKVSAIVADHFEVDDDAEQLSTIGEVVDYIVSHQN